MIRMEALEAQHSAPLPALVIRATSNLWRKCTSSPTLQCEVVMYTRRWLILGVLAASLLPAQDGQQSVQVTGAVKQALTLSADDLAKMPRVSVRTTNNGMETVYEGVWLHEVLKRAGVPQGSELRGKALSGYVMAEAQDGYAVVFSLGETDPA